MPEIPLLRTVSPQDEPADSELVKTFRQGQEDAFNNLVSRYQRQTYHLAFGMTSNHHSAEEISQEAFIRLWKSLKSGGFKEERPIYPWLRTVCLNLTKDYLTDKKREVAVVKEMVEIKNPTSCSEDNIGLADETREKITQAIESLDPERRIVLTLRVIEGLSYKEISQQLDCSIGTVMSRLFRARLELREKLGVLKQRD